ncbi:MAG: type II toxin-antitoxin system VapC family toxin [Kiloniellales bacterium]
MIVVDTNVIAHMLLPSPHTELAERLFSVDPDWIAPILWRSEMRNVLALYLRKSLITLEEAINLQAEAEALLQDKEYEVGARRPDAGRSKPLLGLRLRIRCACAEFRHQTGDPGQKGHRRLSGHRGLAGQLHGGQDVTSS